MANMKTVSNPAAQSDENRSPAPLKSQRPKNISNGGSNFANGMTAELGSMLYLLTSNENMSNEEFKDTIDQC